MSHHAPEILALIRQGFIDDQRRPLPGVQEYFDKTKVYLVKSTRPTPASKALKQHSNMSLNKKQLQPNHGK